MEFEILSVYFLQDHHNQGLHEALKTQNGQGKVPEAWKWKNGGCGAGFVAGEAGRVEHRAGGEPSDGCFQRNESAQS